MLRSVPEKNFSTYGVRDTFSRVRSVLICPAESMTKQSFKDECDINNILSSYEKNGIIEHVSKHGGSYGDFGDYPDYQASLNIVIDAQERFDSLPPLLRNRFSNDPGQFLDFVSDVNNRSEMIHLGLIEPKEPSPPEPLSSEPLGEAKASLVPTAPVL